MAEAAASSFDAPRTWNGEQSRAFEELAFQLLKDKVPPGTQAIRTGNPDGGVEWHAVPPAGTARGWQANPVDGIDAEGSNYGARAGENSCFRPPWWRRMFPVLFG
jgi:hypothetical protein